MKPVRILLVGAAATVALLFLHAFIGWLAFGAVALPAVFVFVGHVFVPMKAGAMSVSLNPELFLSADAPGELPVTISGANVILRPLMRQISFCIERRNFFLLGAIAVVSLALAAWVWQGNAQGEWEGEALSRAWVVYFGMTNWLIVISLSWRWCTERLLLRRCGLKLATAVPAGTGLFHLPRVRYSFTTEGGEYYGATVQHFSHKFNALEVIFYDPRDPHRSVHASGLLFHKLVWQRA